MLARIPTLEQDGLRGGVKYHDGQFDDSRLLVSLAQTATENGACLLNYARVVRLHKDAEGYVSGLDVRDEESGEGARGGRALGGERHRPLLRRPPAGGRSRGRAPRLAQPGGAHRPAARLPARGTAIMVPHTRDGRVMFAIPWHDHVVVGTTDTPIQEVSLEPEPLPPRSTSSSRRRADTSSAGRAGATS